MTRRIHHVGTIPVTPHGNESMTEAALRYAVERTGDYLDEAPAEGIDRADWIIPILRRRHDQPEVMTLKRSDYDKKPTIWNLSAVYLPSWGQKLTCDTMCLEYGRYATMARAALGKYAKNQQLRLQVGIPGPFNLDMMSWGPLAIKYYGLECAAARSEIEYIDAMMGSQAVYQLELPVETYLVAKARSGKIRSRLVDTFARQITDFVKSSPRGTAWIIHLCVGNPRNQPLVTLKNTEPLAQFVDAIYRLWPTTHQLDGFHLPFGDTWYPASPSYDYYRDLGELKLHDTIRIMAGFADASVSLDWQQRVLGVIEDVFQRQVVISAPCGEGRHPDALDASMTRMVALAES